MKRAFKTGALVFMILAMLVGFVACGQADEHDGNVPPDYKLNVVGEITFTMQVNNEEEKLSPMHLLERLKKCILMQL